jgi:2-oxoglutarate dehydrogenase E2 component (dihydrolipoamide succinyltransferase)
MRIQLFHELYVKQGDTEHMTEIKIPSPGESITQVQISRWLAEDGDYVEKDQEIVEVDSDKATFPLVAQESGILRILIAEGETVAVGTLVARIEPSGKQSKKVIEKPVAAGNQPHQQEVVAAIVEKKPPFTEKVLSATPLAGKLIEENKIVREELESRFGKKRITRKDVESFLRTGKRADYSTGLSREVERKKLSTLRIKLAERLVAVRNETAMLTTFNEINMSALVAMKNEFSAAFKEKYGVSLGFVSFFTKAVTLALKDFPQVNSMIENNELVTPRYVDVGIAVSAPKGLVVPVVRNAESMGIPEIEMKIKELASRARDNRITIEDMEGGTFTITNGGVFGSMMSTPILNPPQSAILGLHKVMDRPVAVNGKVEIHPMMYVALSYDHRVIDGRESVSFLVKVKEYIENPGQMLTLGENPLRLLLDL